MPTTNSRPLIITQVGEGQAFLVARGAEFLEPGKAAYICYADIADVLAQTEMEIVHERIFASIDAESEVRSARRAALGAKGLPYETAVTYVQGDPVWGHGFAGVMIQAVAKVGAIDAVWTILDGHRPCGRGWKKNSVTYLCLQNIQGVDNRPGALNTKRAQAERIIERAARLLEKQGASYRDVIRTWFYLSDILAWYDEFNLARNTIYTALGVLPRSNGNDAVIPASTGIGADNPSGSAAAMDLLAVIRASDQRPVIEPINTDRQPMPLRYGSAFSRAVCIDESDARVVHVSGTAAIDAQGHSRYRNDVGQQINDTLDSLEYLLAQKGAKLTDIAAATIFIKRRGDAATFQQVALERALDHVPTVVVIADICRDELLFEIDAEVAISNPTKIVS
jgi:enamine deaminase RidA (YjgF/YER057c/UK114 family)